MFTLSVNDHVMIAHSLPHEFFGPAQALHGATLAVEVTFTREELDEHRVVLDIGEALALLDEALTPLRYTNLDEHPDFAGRLSTSEAIAEYIGTGLSTSLADRPEIGITVHLRENPRAAVSFTVANRP
ncbi:MULTISPECIES: 6-pyruvoyl trahydropterin synthase family protein [unclassified Brevibacterium]|uniref:6-pyruvoyl trahydropterin synthase family protein n=1 Tax=unclassified Brevibacterium TaxID=2614124 RepID=UPI000C52180B|nr:MULTISPECIES: 6-carboxytetrahydropterin synthase [unclassified Brevibacterium]SMX67998.1 6-pyruvoyl tetrahydropterin synthase [Brevibacterium sp. 239c]